MSSVTHASVTPPSMTTFTNHESAAHSVPRANGRTVNVDRTESHPLTPSTDRTTSIARTRMLSTSSSHPSSPAHHTALSQAHRTHPGLATRFNPHDREITAFNDRTTRGVTLLGMISQVKRGVTGFINALLGRPAPARPATGEMTLPQAMPAMPAGVVQTFRDLTGEQRTSLERGEMLVIPDPKEDDIQSANVLTLVPNQQPKAMASVFWDMNNQSCFVPGMTSTEVVQWGGKQAVVTHAINPITFIADWPQKVLPRALYHFFTYNYPLLYEVFQTQEAEGTAYHVRWAIPQSGRSESGEDERGVISFHPKGNGTLIAYSNATQIGFDKQLKRYLPARVMRAINRFTSNLAERYFERTVQNFIARVDALPKKALSFYEAWMDESLKRPGSN